MVHGGGPFFGEAANPSKHAGVSMAVLSAWSTLVDHSFGVAALP